MPFAPAVDEQDGSALPCWTVCAANWTCLDGAAEVATDPADLHTESGRDHQNEASGSDPDQDGCAADGHALTRAFPPRPYFGSGHQADGYFACRDQIVTFGAESVRVTQRPAMGKIINSTFVSI